MLNRDLLVADCRVRSDAAPAAAKRLPVDWDTCSSWNIDVLHRGRHLSGHVAPRLHRALGSALTVLSAMVMTGDDSLTVKLLRHSLHLGEVVSLQLVQALTFLLGRSPFSLVCPELSLRIGRTLCRHL